ncbi:hypothetical protein RJ639_037879 [Escallonia herrerae]|uniref:Uncharacterized protein n=1 Tax=Escallonia herrerae TaxID=1293975 RepID=A0AA89BET9_9ASTE|nr:hypothetical protein RJ639_037879 [Escallonia herrerae]
MFRQHAEFYRDDEVRSVAEGIAAKAMVLDGIISSPHRRTQNPFSSPSFRKPHPRGDELGSCSTLLQRHRFLLTALVLLAFLCTIYLYFAVTLGANESCSELTGTKKALCRMEQAKISVAKGKLKLLVGKFLLYGLCFLVLGYGIKSDKSKIRHLDDHGSA